MPTMEKDTIFISIVIPVYNEAKRIEKFLSDVIAYLQEKTFTYEILIVDDGSSDDTIRVTESFLAHKLKGCYRFLKLPVNQGKGEAVKKGMLEAKGEYIFFIDADGSTSITEIDTFIPQFSPDYDVYIAIRTIKHEAPLKRKLFGYGYIYLTNSLLKMRTSDFTCGFKCYRRGVAQQVFALQTLTNWSFDAENLYVAKKYGYRIKEIPVYWKHYGGSKVKVLKNVIVCGFDLLHIRYNDILGKYALLPRG
jgi:dolichyl-phosphate beta-glucosyltransferase